MRRALFLGLVSILSNLAWGGAVHTIESADNLFLQRHNPQLAKLALAAYRELSEKDPMNKELLWRRAMACQTVGYRLTPDEKAKKALYAEGKQSGRKSLVDNEDCVPCHFWTAINVALYAENSSSFQMLLSLKEIQTHLARVIELDAKYAKAGAHRVMGIIEWKLPGILGGSNAKALAHFQAAIDLLPDEPINYPPFIEFLRTTENNEKAESLLNRALPQPPATDIESFEAWNEWKATGRPPLAISTP